MHHPQGIFIEEYHSGIRSALIVNKQLRFFHYDCGDSGYAALDNIYFGKVVAKSEAGYFVAIGGDRPALLPLEKGMPKLKVGSSVHAQIIREPIQDYAEPGNIKPAKLSQHLTLTGRYVRLTPSRLVPAKLSQQARGLDMDLALLPNGTVVREAAGTVNQNTVTEEVDALQQQLAKIVEDMPAKPGLVYKSPNAYQRLVRDARPGDDIVVNTPKLAAQLKPYTNLQISIEKGNLFAEAGIDDIWGEMFVNVLPLQSGGHVAIHETAAGCMVDVNQGSGKIRDANREAVQRIVEQVQLRGIGGNIAIDFIDVVSVNAKKDLQAQVLKAFGKHDNTRVLGWAPTGWLLLRRDRRRQSITDQLSQICPACHGVGREYNE